MMELGFFSRLYRNTHHKYVRKYLPEITAYSAKVAKVHGDKHPGISNNKTNW